MPKYLIECSYSNGIMCYYINDGEYTVAGERYKVTTENMDEAKRYSTYNRAKSAAERMIGTYVNVDADYKIAEVND